MNQQAPDLPRSVKIIGRYRGLIGFAALLGALVGIVFAALNPPTSSSQALLVFTAPTCPAADLRRPHVLAGLLRRHAAQAVSERSPGQTGGGDVVSISVAAGTAARAEARGDAVAHSYIADVGSVSYMGEYASVRILQRATGATVTTPFKQVAGYALFGAVLGALLGIIAALAGSQTIIDSRALPRELDVGAGDRGAGQPTRYATNGLTLRQLAREYAERTAAPDSPIDG